MSIFGGGKTIAILTFNNTIVTPERLQRYIVKWYHTYIIHAGMDMMKVTSL